MISKTVTPIVVVLFATQLLFSQAASTAMATSSGPVVAYAQLPPLEKQVTEVSLTLSVTDQKGHFIAGLAQGDFAIFDDFRHQTAITFFQNQTDLPLDIALVIDVSASMTGRFPAEKEAIEQFLRAIMRPGDSGQVFAFNQAVFATIPISYQRRKLSSNLKKFAPDGETALYDAVHSAAQWLRQDSRPARRVMILMSDGEDNDSHITGDEAVSSLLDAEAVVYTVNVGDDHESENGKQGVAILRQLSAATGGTYFQTGTIDNVGAAFKKIRRELRSQYAIAYKPSDLSQGRFHNVRVLVRNLRVHCRSGYYTK